jgi:hypothetical protein
MNTDTNLAAWMIAGGPRTTIPSYAREQAHRRSLALARPMSIGPSIASRLTGALAAFRSPRPASDLACCPA